MKTDKEKELDNLFKQGLENPVEDSNFREDDWGAMEAMLDKDKKRPILIYWLPIISAAAAMLLLCLGWLFFKNNDVPTMAGVKPVKQRVYQSGSSTHNSASNAPQTNIAQNGGANQTQTGIAQTGAATTTPENTTATTSGGAKNVSSNGDIKNHPGKLSGVSYASKRQQKNQRKANASANTFEDVVMPANGLEYIGDKSESTLIAANLPAITGLPSTIKNSQLPADNKTIVAAPSKDKIKPVVKQSGFSRTRLAVTVLASPDINGVNTFQNGKVGTNAGLMFSLGVSKRITISTGALYSKKPYLTNFSDYHTNYPFKTNPENVSADCRVLDIPINVDYLVYNRIKNSFSIGTGISSYFMLQENYHYNYEYANTAGPTDYDISNKNKHIFGVLNLDATYQRKISSKFSLNLEPYLKLPLTNIGYSQVKLQSTGLAVGVTWNLGSSHGK